MEVANNHLPRKSEALQLLMGRVETLELCYGMELLGLNRLYENYIIPSTGPLIFADAATNSVWREAIDNDKARNYYFTVFSTMHKRFSFDLATILRNFMFQLVNSVYETESRNAMEDKSWIRNIDTLETISGITFSKIAGWQSVSQLLQIHQACCYPEDGVLVLSIDRRRLLQMITNSRIFAACFEESLRLEHPEWIPA